MKVEERKILDFLKGNNKTYVIPPFQRNYSWEKEQCETLFNDICGLYKKQNELQTEIKNSPSQLVRDALKGESEKCIHYLGTVIWYEGENNCSSYEECILVDGQQRLTSVLLLLCAIRDIISDEVQKESMTEDYLKNKNRNNGYSVRLKQTEYDDECFRNIVEGLALNNEESNVKKRYDTFKELLKESEIRPENILEMLNYVKIVSINLEKMSLEWIQTVFEKINSTGKSLTPADLIRNYLLIANNNEEQTRLYKDYWLRIEKKVGTEKDILDFIIIYLVICTCKADDITENKLYNQFKNYFNNEISHFSDEDSKREEIREKIMKDMLVMSEYYEWFCFDKCKNAKIKRSIEYIKRLEATNFYSVCVYCLSKLSKENEKEMEKIFDLFTDFLIRYRIVSPSSGGGALNSIISDLLKGFQEEDKNSKDYIPLEYDSILHKLSNSKTPNGRFPTDDEFRAKLMQSENYKFRLILLLRMEDVQKPKDFTINIDEASVEHLLPQSVVDGKKQNAKLWRYYLGGDKKAQYLCNEYMHCIGNLALLPKKVNTSISNSIWSEKIQALKEYNNISTTNGIADNYPEWKEENIKERNERMAQLACENITSPLKRDIPYQPYEDFISLSDLEDVTSKKIDSLMYNNDEIEIMGSSQVISWKDFLKAVCKTVYEADAFKFNEAYQKNAFDRKQGTPLVSKEKISDKYEVVDNINFYVFSNGLNANSAFRYAKQIIEACRLNPADFKVKI